MISTVKRTGTSTETSLRDVLWRHLEETYQWYASAALALALFLASINDLWVLEKSPKIIVLQVVTALLVVSGIVLIVLVPSRIRSERKQLISQHAENMKEQAVLLVKGLTVPLNVYAEQASSSESLADKRNAMNSLRMTILTEMRHSLGANSGVRVNLFTVNADNFTLSVKAGNVVGGPRSRNTYASGHDTYENAIEGRGRVEDDCTDPEKFPDIMDHRGEPRYKSFAAFPVIVPGRLFGIVAVDADQVNAFSDLDDSLLSYYSNLLALTFLFENSQVWTPTRGEPESAI